MKPLKDELIQSRLDEDELADFDKVKKLLDVKRNTLKYKGRQKHDDVFIYLFSYTQIEVEVDNRMEY